MKKLLMAVPKGRILEDLKPLFKKINLIPEDDFFRSSSRKLVFSTNHAETMNQHQLSLFGFKLDIMMSSATVSNIGVGFYYFTAYCIVSLIGTQLSYSAFKSDERKAETYHASSEQTS